MNSNEFKDKLTSVTPEVPEHFHNRVEMTLENLVSQEAQMKDSTKQAMKKAGRFSSRTVAIALAITLMLGAVAFAVEPGTYQVVVVGHSSSGNPTMTNPKKIRFDNQDGFSDTFLYSTKVTVSEDDQEVEVDANLHRITSLCRVVFTDAIPDKVTQMHFEYTGGSGAFDAATGLGSVKSTQKVDFEVEPGQEACSFDLYTILHGSEGTLHLKAEAQDANQNIIRERAFEVPMKQRVITKLSGPYFSGSDGSTITIVIGINTDWEGEQTIEFN